MAYIGSKGSVMVADKRRIAYFGEKEHREILEESLYSGQLKTDEDFNHKAKQLNVSYKITEDANKIKNLENAIVGEVSTRSTTETKRKRIYSTTNDYRLIELLDSDIIYSESGEKGIIIFGNKITKSLASKYINQMMKPNVSLRFIGDIFLKVFENVSSQTPSIGKKYDVLIQQPKFNSKEAKIHLDNIIEIDVKLLGKFRDELKTNLSQSNEKIQLTSKIIYEGDIGKVTNIENNMLQVTLNDDVQAFDPDWKLLAKPKDNVLMIITDEKTARIGDEVVIEDETLCLKRNKGNLDCNIILSKV
ncbi:MAG: DUF2121 domain-containing protein [Methanobrevibacter sp.]|jgi:hypothetical protein|nr:DUF2121 domain-containing protein [Methanobrevibacter sp.]